MAATDFTADDLPWDLNKWLVVDPGERVTDHAIEILEDAGSADRVTVKRVLEYASGERPARAVKPNDWVRVLEHADGRLALVSWSSWGVTEIGLKEDPDQRRQFDVWMFSALRDDEQRDDATNAGVSDLLRASSPSIVPVWESHLRPEIVSDGGQSTDGTERREVADQPALVTHCTGCGKRVGLDRHIKSIGDRCYAVCYGCSPLGTAEEPQQQKLVTDGGRVEHGTNRYHEHLTCEHTYVCDGCSRVFGDYDQAVEHVNRCVDTETDRSGGDER